MSIAEYVPGPWTASPEEASDRRGIAITSPAFGGCVLATITPPEDEGPADETDWANANLIAAAPELYAACREAMALISQLKKAGARIYGSDAIIEAALAKARGEAS